MTLEFKLRFNTLIISIFLLFGFFAYGQSEPREITEIDFANWRVLMQVDGPSNWRASINAVKPLNSKWTIRMGLSPLFSFYQVKSGKDFPIQYSSFESLNKSKSFGVEFSLGTEYHILQQSKVDPYIFFGSGFGISNQRSYRETNYEYRVADLFGLLARSSESTWKGAPKLSFNPFLGFGVNYFFHPRLAIGVEYSIGPGMALIKGSSKQEEVIQETFENGDVQIEHIEEERSTNSFNLDIVQNVGLHFIYIVKGRNKE